MKFSQSYAYLEILENYNTEVTSGGPVPGALDRQGRPCNSIVSWAQTLGSSAWESLAGYSEQGSLVDTTHTQSHNQQAASMEGQYWAPTQSQL